MSTAVVVYRWGLYRLTVELDPDDPAEVDPRAPEATRRVLLGVLGVHPDAIAEAARRDAADDEEGPEQGERFALEAAGTLALLLEPEAVCWHDADPAELDDDDRAAVDATGLPLWRVLDARLHPPRVAQWYAAQAAYVARLEDRVAELELAASAAAARRRSTTSTRVARAMLGPWGVA